MAFVVSWSEKRPTPAQVIKNNYLIVLRFYMNEMNMVSKHVKVLTWADRVESAVASQQV